MLNRYRDWKRRQDERRVAKWAKTRQKGKSYFVSGFAFCWCIGMTTVFSVVNYLSGEPVHIALITVYLVITFLGGVVVGLVNWWQCATEYFKHFPAAEEIYNITGREI